MTIAEGGGNNGADWTTPGSWSPAPPETTGLMRVSVAGGELTEFTQPDSAKGEREHVWPIALPDGRGVVFTIWSGALGRSRLAIASLEDGAVTRLDVKGIRPLAVVDGALVYVQADGAVMAVPFDHPGGRSPASRCRCSTRSRSRRRSTATPPCSSPPEERWSRVWKASTRG